MLATQPEDLPAGQAVNSVLNPQRRSTDDESSDVGAFDPEKFDEASTYAPISAPLAANDERIQRLHLASSRSVERSWSLNDGYSCHTADEEAGEKLPAEEQGKGGDDLSAFMVGWDENDPMNPRNFNTLRRWMIVIICSMGSLCV
ncbi:hypothetical protein EYZ11_007270 [Aspergillus tanneri]|uniref:Uncharacterized protein n=1 Tax=Aspergillus tanneri TaxID=1220188 RepID=A0A4S3JJ18_9EURO|nr:hypothetical protein EYZ11_007270 [Aspergillus tanneri]